MDNCVPGHDVPHPEWVGWSNDKRECMTEDVAKPPQKAAVIGDIPVPVPEKKSCNCWKRTMIFFLVLIILILAYFLWRKWKNES